jgi:hypothetical protein
MQYCEVVPAQIQMSMEQMVWSLWALEYNAGETIKLRTDTTAFTIYIFMRNYNTYLTFFLLFSNFIKIFQCKSSNDKYLYKNNCEWEFIQ